MKFFTNNLSKKISNLKCIEFFVRVSTDENATKLKGQPRRVKF